MSNSVTALIERKPVFIIARNEFEATAHARAKFERRANGYDSRNSSLLHHTSSKPVYKCVMLANGEILVGVHK
jgi:hypothetical protein